MATLRAKAPRMLYTSPQHFLNNSVWLQRKFAMDTPSAAAAAASAATESSYKEAKASDSTANNRFSDRIIPHILRLYGSRATSHDFEIYAPHASFEDPLMCARGVKQIKSAFYTLPKIFSESKIVEFSVEENMVSPGKGEILIDNKQYYKFLGKDIDMISLIKLNIEEGKVVRHEDWWDKKQISNRETAKLPLLGRIAEMTRRGSMLVTHVLMRFGKDPTE